MKLKILITDIKPLEHVQINYVKISHVIKQTLRTKRQDDEHQDMV